jgi:hypothetical protein
MLLLPRMQLVLLMLWHTHELPSELELLLVAWQPSC